MSAESRLQELGLTLPEITVPVANYVHAVRTGNLLFLAGKGPVGAAGKVGADISPEQAYDHARQVGLLLVAVLRQELGSLDKVRRVVKILGFVNSTPDFREHPKVINGCAGLMVEIFGDRG